MPKYKVVFVEKQSVVIERLIKGDEVIAVFVPENVIGVFRVGPNQE